MLKTALQLYSVRDDLAADFKGTVEKVKAMGYAGVELSGLGDGDDPKEVKKILDDLGLEVMSSHVPFAKMLENPDKTFEDYKTVGCRFVVIPWLPWNDPAYAAKFDDAVADITRAGKCAAEHGLTLLYHNHNFEFERIGGEYILDKIYASVDEKYLKTQIDTCWVKVGGEDPAAYVRKYTGRAPLVHLKDFSGGGTEGLFDLIGAENKKVKTDGDFRFRPIGQGVQDFPSIISAAKDAGAEWIIVEQDSSVDIPPMEAARQSREYLLSIGY